MSGYLLIDMEQNISHAIAFSFYSISDWSMQNEYPNQAAD